MFRYLTQRLLYMVPVVWIVVSAVFLLIHIVPGDPIQQMLGEGAAGADIAAARRWGWEPRRALADGLGLYVRWFKEQA